MPLVKIVLTGDAYTKWLMAKAELSAGKEITNTKALERLVSQYNRRKGSKLI